MLNNENAVMERFKRNVWLWVFPAGSHYGCSENTNVQYEVSICLKSKFDFIFGWYETVLWSSLYYNVKCCGLIYNYVPKSICFCVINLRSYVMCQFMLLIKMEIKYMKVLCSWIVVNIMLLTTKLHYCYKIQS